MIAPVQRVGRYKMLLNEILKHLKKKNLIEDANCLNDAITMIGVNFCNHDRGNFTHQFNNICNVAESLQRSK